MAGMTVLLLLLWAGVTVSSPVDLQKRVVRGKPCEDDERKYHVYVRGFDGSKSYMCGGSLIHESWVLTAAHCNKGKVFAAVGVHPGELDGTKKQGVEIKDPVFYEQSGQRHDLMLLKLPEASTITPIDLPTEDDCKNKISTVEVAGYGGDPPPSTLQCGDMNMLSKTVCDEIKAGLKTCPDPVAASKHYQNIICYSSITKLSATAAEGDSGGGVVDSKNKNTLYGVHVAGSDGAPSCLSVGIAMDLCNQDYRNWIKEHTKIPFN